MTLLVATTVTGCANSTGESDPGNPDQVEVLTSWSSTEDAKSFRVLLDTFSEQHPGIQVIHSAVKGVGAAASALEDRLAANNPPDVFLAPAAPGLAPVVADGELVDLTDFARDLGLTANVRPDLLDLLKVGSHLYSVPTGVHRVNVVWTNASALARAGIPADKPAAGLDAWLADLAALRAAGIEYPLALGDSETQLELFESVLIADFGPEEYVSLWTKSDAWNDATLLTAVDHYRALLEYTDPATEASGWQATTKKLIVNGTTGYVVMSDRALGVFRNVGLEYNEQYSSFPVPGTTGAFDLFFDAFALPQGVSHPDAAREWLQTAASPEAQQAFSLANGSTPVLSGPFETTFPAYQRAAMLDLGLVAPVPSLAYGAAADRHWTEAIARVLADFRHDDRSLAFANALRSAAIDALG
ncbi:MAG TPA: ABC transporter substrate-binding protein [Pseudolysinimonas sp.]